MSVPIPDKISYYSDKFYRITPFGAVLVSDDRINKFAKVIKNIFNDNYETIINEFVDFRIIEPLYFVDLYDLDALDLKNKISKDDIEYLYKQAKKIIEIVDRNNANYYSNTEISTYYDKYYNTDNKVANNYDNRQIIEAFGGKKN